MRLLFRRAVRFFKGLFARKYTREELEDMSRKGLIPPIHHNCRCVIKTEETGTDDLPSQ